jgi:hypothetical protein
VIVHSAVLPCAAELRTWGVWGTFAKGDRPAGLLDMVRVAHAAERAARADW